MTRNLVSGEPIGAGVETYWLEETETDLPTHDDWLSSEEALLFGRMRFPKRRADWKLGRWTAKRAAAAYLNLPVDTQTLRDIEVRPAASGAPELFVVQRPAALTMSISHRVGIAACAIAMADAQLGCDLELIEPRDESFIRDYFTGEEQQLISLASEEDRPQLVTLLWSAKESALKALREGLRTDTRSLIVALDGHTDAAALSTELKHHSRLNGWRALKVDVQGEVFQGWWQSKDQVVRTLVGTPAPLPPVLLSACGSSSPLIWTRSSGARS